MNEVTDKKVVVILSGGMDSTTLLYKVLSENPKGVRALSFNYGQKHKAELESARMTCESLNVNHKIINIDFMAQLLSNSALTGDVDMPEGAYDGENMKLTVVPNRNMILLSIAIGYAVNEEYDVVGYGAHAGDHTIYPDCRPAFVDAMDHVSRIANFRPIQIYAPFLNIDKGDIAILGKELNVDYSMTLTCYRGMYPPCGKCGACQERAYAFKKAEMIDPLTV